MHRLGCFVPIYSFLGFALLYTFLDPGAGRFLWVIWPVAFLVMPVVVMFGLSVNSVVDRFERWQRENTPFAGWRRNTLGGTVIFILILFFVLNGSIYQSSDISQLNGRYFLYKMEDETAFYISPDEYSGNGLTLLHDVHVVKTQENDLTLYRQVSSSEVPRYRTPALRLAILFYLGIFLVAGFYFWYIDRITEEETIENHDPIP
jgi:hypothetical protein